MEAELIPGLPDCLALDCLLRLPFHAILDAQTVCKRWNHELTSSSFYRIRRDAGLAHRIVCLLLRGKLPHTIGRLYLALYEPATGFCTMRKLAADRPNDKKGCSNAVVIGRDLVVIGGWDNVNNCRTSEIYIYDLLSGAWRLGAPKPAPEQVFYRCGLKGGKLFVVCGRDDDEGKRLRSVVAYDVSADAWFEMPDLRQDKGGGASVDGNFWRNREEYKDAIGWSKMLLFDGVDDLRLCPTEEGKEVVICLVGERSKGKVMAAAEVTLKEEVLGTLRRRLGLLPDDIHEYLQSYFYDWW